MMRYLFLQCLHAELSEQVLQCLAGYEKRILENKSSAAS